MTTEHIAALLRFAKIDAALADNPGVMAYAYGAQGGQMALAIYAALEELGIPVEDQEAK